VLSGHGGPGYGLRRGGPMCRPWAHTQVRPYTVGQASRLSMTGKMPVPLREHLPPLTGGSEGGSYGDDGSEPSNPVRIGCGERSIVRNGPRPSPGRWRAGTPAPPKGIPARRPALPMHLERRGSLHSPQLRECDTEFEQKSTKAAPGQRIYHGKTGQIIRVDDQCMQTLQAIRCMSCFQGN